MDDQRYHLTLSAAGRPVMQGWWADEAVARGKFTEWIGEFSNIASARVALADEETGAVLTTWPDEP